MRAAVLAFVVLVALPCRGFADCATALPPDVALQQTAAVFVGRVVSAGRQGEWHVYEFDAEFAWKGVTSRRVKVLSTVPGCARGCYFEVGRSYLVYAQSELDGLVAHNCSRTTELSGASEDMAVLGRPPLVFPVEPASAWSRLPLGVFALGVVVGGAVVAAGWFVWSRRRIGRAKEA